MLWPVLGGLRFFLALIVAAHHLPLKTYLHEQFLARMNGVAAVYAFLLLSGYAIAASYEKDVDRFYLRRALRILPVYVLSLLMSVLVAGVFTPAGVLPSYQDLFLNLCFAQGTLTDPLTTNPVVWSLAIEVFFYAVTPWLATFANRTLMRLMIASAILFATVRVFVPTFGAHQLAMWVIVFAWTWLAGFWLHRKGRRFVSWQFVLILGVIVIPMDFRKQADWSTLTWVMTVFLLRYGGKMKFGSRVKAAMNYSGDISYALYLVHWPTYAAIVGLGYKLNGLAIPAAIGVSVMADLCFDRPVKRVALKLASLYEKHRPTCLSVKRRRTQHTAGDLPASVMSGGSLQPE